MVLLDLKFGVIFNIIMIQFPQKVKYKKLQRTQLKKINKIKPYIQYTKSIPSLITQNTTTLTFRQIEAFRRVLIRKVKTLTNLIIPIVSDLSSTAKPTAMRMGKGKGNFKIWICKLKSGTKIFQFKGPLVKNQIQNLLKTNKFNKLSCTLKFF